MALAYDRDRLTRDVDALFVPAPEVRRIAEEMSGPHGLEPDWLNDAAKGFLPGTDEHPRTVFESEAILVQVPSPEYLLAMKLQASRDDRDLDDAALLFNRLGYTTAQECIDLLSATYPSGQLLPRHRYIAGDVVTRAHARRDAGSRPSMTASTRSKTPGSTAQGQALTGQNAACSENTPTRPVIRDALEPQKQADQDRTTFAPLTGFPAAGSGV